MSREKTVVKTVMGTDYGSGIWFWRWANVYIVSTWRRYPHQEEIELRRVTALPHKEKRLPNLALAEKELARRLVLYH